MTTICQRPGCGKPMPTRRSSTGLLRVYCSRGCAQQRSRKITINHEQASRPKRESVSWWLETATFYEEARQRFPVEPVGLLQKGWTS